MPFDSTPEQKTEVIPARLPTKVGFICWLQTKSPKEIVGLSFSVHYCPIAQYIKETYNPYYVSVANTDIRINERVFGSPLWAQDFTVKVDNAWRYRFRSNKSIKAKHALRIMRKI